MLMCRVVIYNKKKKDLALTDENYHLNTSMKYCVHGNLPLCFCCWSLYMKAIYLTRTSRIFTRWLAG